MTGLSEALANLGRQVSSPDRQSAPVNTSMRHCAVAPLAN